MLFAEVHKPGEIIGLIIFIILVLVFLGLLIWGAWKPIIWRLLSVAGMTFGSGMLVGGLVAIATDALPDRVSAANVVGVGTGLLVGAIGLLVISFCGGKPRKEKPHPDNSQAAMPPTEQPRIEQPVAPTLVEPAE